MRNTSFLQVTPSLFDFFLFFSFLDLACIVLRCVVFPSHLVSIIKLIEAPLMPQTV